jgi:hypothetical protein
MSGTMMPQGGGAPQIPPQIMQALMAQQAQRGGGGGGAVPQMPMGGPSAGPQMPPRPGMQPPGPPGMAPPGASPQGAPPPQPPGPMSQIPPMPVPPPQGAPNPNLAAFARMAQGHTGGQQPRLTPAEMAHLGRFGDQVIAHLTPGEMTVPPEVQTPKILHDLQQAFSRVGVSPQQFTAGSPASSVNPNTGAPEYSLWSAILPVLGAVGGAVAAPYTGGLSVPAGMAIGGALGGAAGGLADHGTAAQIALQAAGGGAGGYLGGAMGGAASGAAGAAGAAGTEAAGMTAPQVASAATNFTDPAFAGATSGVGSVGNATNAVSMAAPTATGGATSLATPAASNLSTFGSMVKNLPLKGGMMAGTGAALGGMLAPQPGQGAPQMPAGFNTPMQPLNRNPNALWGRPGQSPTPQFAGYNPYASVTSGHPYNFFPQS